MVQNQYNKPLNAFTEYITSEEKYLKSVVIFANNDKAYYDPDCKSPINSDDLYDLFKSGKLYVVDVSSDAEWVPGYVKYDSQANVCLGGLLGSNKHVYAQSAEYQPEAN